MGKTFSTGLLTNGIWQDASNNIGIGGSPSGSYKLEVTGTAKVSSTLLVSGASTLTGNVGIGTSSSNGNLQFATAVNTRKIVLFEGGNNDYQFYGFGVESNKLIYSTNGTADDHVFVASASSSTRNELMRIKGNGNVGIGTSSPVGLLQLNGSIVNSADAATLTIKQSSTTYTNGIYLERGGERNGYHIYIGGDLDALTFRRNYVGTQSNVMSLTRDGNVGIGTTNPPSRLSVQWDRSTAFSGLGVYDQQAYNASNHGGTITFGGTYNSGGSITEWSGIGGNKENTTDGDYSGTLVFYTRPNGSGMTERMRITSGGTSTVLLGKTTSLYATTSRASLEINGVDTSILALTRTNDATATAYIYYAADNNIYFQNNKAGGAIYIQSGNSGGVQLTAGSTAFAPQSDERLKNIQGNIENAIDKLSTLRTVIYSWKSDEENKENLGLIAQDVQKVFPQVIEKSIIKEDPINGISDDTTQYLSLKYTDLIPVLVKAIQEQQIQIQNLQEQNQDLKSRLDKAGL